MDKWSGKAKKCRSILIRYDQKLSAKKFPGRAYFKIERNQRQWRFPAPHHRVRKKLRVRLLDAKPTIFQPFYQ